MKDMGDALNKVSKTDYFNIPPTLQVPNTSLDVASNLSERGSNVPTPTAAFTATTVEVPIYDGSLASEADSPTDSFILHTNGASDSPPSTSTPITDYDSSVGSDGPPRGHKVRKSLSDSYWVLGPS
jgi:hypothetical protein